MINLDLVKSDSKIIQLNSNWGCWKGDIPAVFLEKPAKDMRLKWTGSPIPVSLFREILSFFKWTSDTFKTESQLRLYYHPMLKIWRAVPMPQFIISGSFSKENDAHEDFARLKRELETAGFGHAGSAHHHHAMSAFQSGTDHKDEIDVEGFHFTVGNMQSEKASFHSRCVVRKFCYSNFNLSDFLPYTEDVLRFKNLPPFPEEWKGRMVEKPRPEPVRWGFDSWKQGAPAPTRIPRHTQWEDDDPWTDEQLEAANRYYAKQDSSSDETDELIVSESILEGITQSFSLTALEEMTLYTAVDAMMDELEPEDLNETVAIALYEFILARIALREEKPDTPN